jgi:aspartate/methionine/tyrosine aminotransferase
MPFEAFALERWQAEWEHVVRYNLSESGVRPMRLADLLALAGEVDLEGETLGYAPTQGTPALRRRVADLHPGATDANVLVTSGSAEANFLATWEIVRPGDEVVSMTPNYLQIAGLARSLGATVRPWPLVDEGDRWEVDGERLKELVTSKTTLLALCHPNNPTGRVLSEDVLQAAADVAEDAGAWLLSDEVYRGAELEGPDGPTLWGRLERAVVVGGLSKAYGLPGLRVGWAVAPQDLIERLWARHDYTTIAAATLSQRLAALALDHRSDILGRTRRILRENLPVLQSWLDDHRDVFRYAPPEAGAICFARCLAHPDTRTFAERLRQTEDVLLVPGDHFGTPGYVRFGYGGAPDDLRASLARIDRFLRAEG